jgi:hypothetical protein
MGDPICKICKTKRTGSVAQVAEFKTQYCQKKKIKKKKKKFMSPPNKMSPSFILQKEETETQKGKMTYSRSHSQEVAGLRLDPAAFCPPETVFSLSTV